MKKYIENIRVSVKKNGYIPTSDQIRQAIDIVCPNGVDILSNKAAIINETIKLINLSHESTITETVQTDNSPLPTPDTSEVDSTEIVVTQEDKSELITSQAAAYEIELSEAEVIELSSNIGDRFTDYAEFVHTTKQVIQSYTEQRYDCLERQINDTSEDLKSYFIQREKQLNQKLATGLGEINNFFRTKSTKQKELSKVIAAAFQIPTG